MAYSLSRRMVVIATLVLALFVTGTAAATDIAYDDSLRSPSAGAMAFDAVIVRPLSLAATVAGTGLFIVSLPFSAIGKNTSQAGDQLVVAPARYTFARPLGNFEAESREY